MGEKEFVFCVFDVETTGMNAQRDQIIELSIKRGLNNDALQQTWRFKPRVPICPQAQAVHGISMEDLKDCPSFGEYARLIRGLFMESDALVGYNLEFDLSFIQAELHRAGIPEIDLQQKLILDPCRLWAKLEPRTLSDAYRRFVGGALEGAHGAAADVSATGAVLAGMVRSFGLQDKSWEQIAAICGIGPKNWIGPTNHIQWRENQPVLSFGKHRFRPLHELSQEDGGSYLRWVIESDFPEHVKLIAKQAQSKSASELREWLVATFGGGK